MKRVHKGTEPSALTAFKALNPNATWNDIRNDGAYTVCRDKAINDQKSLCAYCEKELDAHRRPQHCRIEHFHPKSDSAERNWHLDWDNMLATCDGGESDDKIINPLPENLSCDAHKNHLTNKGQLAIDAIEKSMLNPLDLPLFPNIFTFNPINGCLTPVASICAEAGVDIHKLERTVKILNLNCTRLSRARRTIYHKIKRRQKELLGRQHNQQKVTDIMLKEYFNSKRWPEYFTTYRCCLGQAAEKYLQSIHYNG